MWLLLFFLTLSRFLTLSQEFRFHSIEKFHLTALLKGHAKRSNKGQKEGGKINTETAKILSRFQGENMLIDWTHENCFRTLDLSTKFTNLNKLKVAYRPIYRKCANWYRRNILAKVKILDFLAKKKIINFKNYSICQQINLKHGKVALKCIPLKVQFNTKALNSKLIWH